VLKIHRHVFFSGWGWPGNQFDRRPQFRRGSTGIQVVGRGRIQDAGGSKNELLVPLCWESHFSGTAFPFSSEPVSLVKETGRLQRAQGQIKNSGIFHETPPELSRETQEKQNKIIGTKDEHLQASKFTFASIQRRPPITTLRRGKSTFQTDCFLITPNHCSDVLPTCMYTVMLPHAHVCCG
jgi:hypothetical protein